MLQNIPSWLQNIPNWLQNLVEQGLSPGNVLAGIVAGILTPIIISRARIIASKLNNYSEKAAEVLPRKRNRDDWENICDRMLVKEPTSNLLTTGKGVTFEFDDFDVYSRLLEEKKNRASDKQINKIFTDKEFFERVIKKRKYSKNKGLRIAVVGEAGNGKTIWLQKIAIWIKENQLGWPIWIPLKKIETDPLKEGKTPNLPKYLMNEWLDDATGTNTAEIKEDFKQQFNKKRVWLLLDALDETTAATNQNFLESLHSGWIAEANILLSCRLDLWEIVQNDLSSFDVYRILNFNREQVKKFIENWFTKTKKIELGNRLVQALGDRNKKQVADLVSNPLCCTLLCRTWQVWQGELPNNQAELYDQFITGIFDEWYEIKKQERERYPNRSKAEARSELKRKLGEVAKLAIDKTKSRFLLEQKLIDPELKESEVKLLLDSNLLRLVKKGKEYSQNFYEFLHPTFQEYFASLAIEDRDFFLPRQHNNKPENDWNNSSKYRRYRIFEPQWKKVILFWLGRDDLKINSEKKQEFISALINFKDGCGTENFYGYRAYFLVAAALAEFKDFGDRDLADNIVKQLVISIPVV